MSESEKDSVNLLLLVDGLRRPWGRSAGLEGLDLLDNARRSASDKAPVLTGASSDSSSKAGVRSTGVNCDSVTSLGPALDIDLGL